MSSQTGRSRDNQDPRRPAPDPQIQAARIGRGAAIVVAKIGRNAAIVTAIIGAAATVVATLVAVTAARGDHNDKKSPPTLPDQVATGAPSENPTPYANGTPSIPPSATTNPPHSPAIRYKGKVSVTTDAKDLDQNPPVKVDEYEEEGGDLDYNQWFGEISTEGDAGFAVWESDKPPSYSECEKLAAAASVDSMELKVGTTVCARTDEGRTARMKLIHYPDCYCAIFDAVIWELPSVG